MEDSCNKPLTVAQLIAALKLLNPDAIIEFEYDGMDTYEFKRAYGFNVADDNSSIQIVGDPEKLWP